MTTKTVYVAFDGTNFNTEKACLDYEKSMSTEVVMFDECGESTPDCALVVHLSDDNAAKCFIRMCEEAEAPFAGIDQTDMGWFVWDDYHTHWVGLDYCVVEALRNGFNTIGGNE